MFRNRLTNLIMSYYVVYAMFWYPNDTVDYPVHPIVYIFITGLGMFLATQATLIATKYNKFFHYSWVLIYNLTTSVAVATYMMNDWGISLPLSFTLLMMSLLISYRKLNSKNLIYFLPLHSFGIALVIGKILEASIGWNHNLVSWLITGMVFCMLWNDHENQSSKERFTSFEYVFIGLGIPWASFMLYCLGLFIVNVNGNSTHTHYLVLLAFVFMLIAGGHNYLIGRRLQKTNRHPDNIYPFVLKKRD